MNENNPVLTPEITEVLSQYLEVQQKEKDLQEEKKDLQKKLKDHLRNNDGQFWYPEVNGQRLKIYYKSTTEIKYDEELLRKRLGDRFPTILKPNINKIRKELQSLEPCLEPYLNIIGSPDREKVRQQIDAGLVSKSEFKDAFKKSANEKVAVMRNK